MCWCLACYSPQLIYRILNHVPLLGSMPCPDACLFRAVQRVDCLAWVVTAGTILASCSDDNTARVWSTNSATCIHRLAEHSKEIYTIKWSNTGPGTANPQARLLLVTASFDATIRCVLCITACWKHEVAVSICVQMILNSRISKADISWQGIDCLCTAHLFAFRTDRGSAERLESSSMITTAASATTVNVTCTA